MRWNRLAHLALVALVLLAPFARPGRTASQEIPNPSHLALPFSAGEKLIYEIKLSRFPLNVTLGHIIFEYAGLAPNRKIEEANMELSADNKRELHLLRAEAVSKGFFVSLVGINVQDRFQTLVDREDFSAQLSYREEDEGKKHLAKTSLFDPIDRLVKYKVIDLNKPDAPPKITAVARKERMQSLLSAIYYIRTFPLRDDDIVCYPVSEDEENHEFEILVRGREVIQFGDGKLATIKLEPKLFGPGRIFSREGEMQMWLTDDERRIPVRLVAKTSSGTVTATLTNYEAQPTIQKRTNPAPQ